MMKLNDVDLVKVRTYISCVRCHTKKINEIHFESRIDLSMKIRTSTASDWQSRNATLRFAVDDMDRRKDRLIRQEVLLSITKKNFPINFMKSMLLQRPLASDGLRHKYFVYFWNVLGNRKRWREMISHEVGRKKKKRIRWFNKCLK